MDDTNILFHGETLQQLITEEMTKLKRWFDNNKFSLNLIKTKIMIFGISGTDTDANVTITLK